MRAVPDDVADHVASIEGERFYWVRGIRKGKQACEGEEERDRGRIGEGSVHSMTVGVIRAFPGDDAAFNDGRIAGAKKQL